METRTAGAAGTGESATVIVRRLGYAHHVWTHSMLLDLDGNKHILARCGSHVFCAFWTDKEQAWEKSWASSCENDERLAPCL